MFKTALYFSFYSRILSLSGFYLSLFFISVYCLFYYSIYCSSILCLSFYLLALFSFVSDLENKQAEYIVSYLDNSYYISILSDSILVLDIGFYIYRKLSKTLVILEQSINIDIYIKSYNIAKIQYSFEIDLDTGIVIFCNRLFAKSNQVFGKNTILFEYKYICQVLV